MGFEVQSPGGRDGQNKHDEKHAGASRKDRQGSEGAGGKQGRAAPCGGPHKARHDQDDRQVGGCKPRHAEDGHLPEAWHGRSGHHGVARDGGEKGNREGLEKPIAGLGTREAPGGGAEKVKDVVHADSEERCPEHKREHVYFAEHGKRDGTGKG